MAVSDFNFEFECDVITHEGCFPSFVEGSAKYHVDKGKDLSISVFDVEYDLISTFLVEDDGNEKLHILVPNHIRNWDYIRSRVVEYAHSLLEH